MKFKDIVVSGTRPTGNLHLGNYLGAVKQFVKMQEEFNSFFFIADFHSLTTHPKPADLQKNVRTVLAEYLACGLNPEKTVLYAQSDVPQIAELYMYFNMIAYKGELERVATFKDKVRQHPENVNAGLLTYPTLMAADILIHKGTLVPVGKDQEQHLEMTRTYARRFNTLYSAAVFPEPQAYSSKGKLVKIPGLDGSGKMSKSSGDDNSLIYLIDTPKQIQKKVMRAVTDTGPTDPNIKSESVQNLFTLMEHVSSPETIQHFEEAYQNLTIRYGDLKKQLAEDMVNFLNPVREHIEEIFNDESYLNRVMDEGAEKARESAQKVINEVRKAIGLRV